MCANRLRVFFALAAVALPGAVAAQSPVARDTAIMLKGRVVSEDDILSFPLEVVVFAGKLLVREWWPDPWFHLIDPAGPILSSFGRRGDGPGDVNFLHGMTRAPSGEGGALWVTDGGRRFKRLAMEDGRPRVTEVIDLAFPGAVARHLLQVGDSAFLAVTGQLDGPSKHDRRFVRIDRRGRFIADVGPPIRGDSVVPLADRSKMDVGKAHLNPSGTRIAVAYPFRSIVEIYDTSGRKLATALPPSPADRFENQFKKPAFPTDPWFHTGDPEFRHGYLNVATTDDFIFALFSGRLESEQSELPKPSGDRIHVFDWTGRLVKVLRFDRIMQRSLAVDDQGTTLYSSRWHPVPGVYAFALPPEFRTKRR